MGYVRSHYRRGRLVRGHVRRGGGGCGNVAAFIVLGIAAGLWAAWQALTAFGEWASGFVAEHSRTLALAGAVAVAAAMAVVVMRELHARRTWRLLELAASMRDSRSADDAAVGRLEEARRHAGPLPAAVEAELAERYSQLVAHVVSDGVVDEREQEHLRRVARALALPSATEASARRAGFLEVFADVVGDGRLTQDEEARLDAVRRALDVPESDVRAQLARVDELVEARQVETRTPTPIDRPGLRRGETCHHATPATEVKDVVTSRRIVRGEPKVERELKDTRTGELLVTNRRILFVSEGTTSIRLGDLIECAIDPETGLLSLIADGRKNAVRLRVSRPHVTRAHVDRARAAMDAE